MKGRRRKQRQARMRERQRHRKTGWRADQRPKLEVTQRAGRLEENPIPQPQHPQCCLLDVVNVLAWVARKEHPPAVAGARG